MRPSKKPLPQSRRPASCRLIARTPGIGAASGIATGRSSNHNPGSGTARRRFPSPFHASVAVVNESTALNYTPDKFAAGQRTFCSGVATFRKYRLLVCASQEQMSLKSFSTRDLGPSTAALGWLSFQTMALDHLVGPRCPVPAVGVRRTFSEAAGPVRTKAFVLHSLAAKFELDDVAAKILLDEVTKHAPHPRSPRFS